MNINCKNISDFCELVRVSVGHDLKNQCVFASSKQGYPSLAFPNTPKDHKTFTYVLFTPLYTAIYSGNIKDDLFDKEYDLLKETCSKYEIYIHTFDKLSYNSDTNTVSLENPIDVI